MPKPTPRHTRASRAVRRLSLLLAGLLSLAVATAAGGTIAYLRIVRDAVAPVPIPTGLLDEEGPARATGPTSALADRVTNVIVVGSDSREVLSEAEQSTKGDADLIGGQRSDTLILVQLDPRRQKAVMIHFPRDLLVEIPGYGQDKINTAYNTGGPSLVIKTVKRLTGLPVHHYVEVNFMGFRRLVDTVGGVRICTDRPLIDEVAGLHLREPGCRILGGQRALAFVRARHVEGDVIPDFARIARQQQFIRALLNKLLSVRSLLNFDLVREAAGNISTDESLTPIDMYYLARELQKLAAEKGSAAAEGVDFRVVPSAPKAIDGISYVIPDEEQMRLLFERLGSGRPLGRLGRAAALTDPSPATIHVQVYDAGGKRAAEVQRKLLGAGFAVAALRSAPPHLTESVIRYASESLGQVVARRYPKVRTEKVPRAELGDADVIVVVGPTGFRR